jgi:hypothetical protein
MSTPKTVQREINMIQSELMFINRDVFYASGSEREELQKRQDKLQTRLAELQKSLKRV